jgi:dTDP-4-dehydrorhamnose 3,5-epimerase
MRVVQTDFAEVKVLHPQRHLDNRGFFSEVYNRQALQAIGIATAFVQDNHSLSVQQGVVRGLHFQLAPFAQAKLVRVPRGAIFDVVVDIRHGSPTFGQHSGSVLSAEAWNQLYVPQGFAHGFCTLEPNTEVIYKVNRPYSAAHERGFLWNDPALEIPWPVALDAAVVSDKDRNLPKLAELPASFRYDPGVPPIADAE